METAAAPETVEPVETAVTRIQRQPVAELLSVVAVAEAATVATAAAEEKVASVLQTAMPLQHRSVVAEVTVVLRMAATVVPEAPAEARLQSVEERRPTVPTERAVSGPDFLSRK